MSRILRCLVCFLLICCILVNCSPLRARAVVPEWILVELGIVVASSLIGIGISAGTEAQAQVFTNVVNNACDWLQNSTEHVIFDSLTNAAKVLVYSTGNSKLPYMVNQSLVEDLRGWLWDSEVVTSADCSDLSFAVNGNLNRYYTISGHFDGLTVQYNFSNGAHTYVSYLVSTSDFIGYRVDADGSETYIDANGPTTSGLYYVTVYNQKASQADLSKHPVGFRFVSIDLPADTVDGYILDGVTLSDVTSTLDLSLDYIPSLSEEFSTGYADWFANASVAADSSTGDDIPVVPVGLGKTQDETSGYSQSGVWSGTSTYVDISTDMETGSGSTTGSATLSDVISEIKAIPQSIAGFFADVVAAVQAIPAAIADIFVPSAGLDYFSISLSDYFPFCIPFDIYDFLVCLNADPVAPVIEWEIYLPGGDTYPLEIDLSAFDSVAQLLRVLELLVFCIGLAAKTRDLIKG